ncbi:hypothetical protein BJ166DRAFT_614211 [Pestalotiopsis sp. NC0098]|nr:hypothetical protein BJ166DRAFT_614211 [Pestalotiopsis sp. NC0098]
MATTRPAKHDMTLLDKLIYIYSNMADSIKFLLHFICLWWLFGLVVLVSVPVIRRYIVRTVKPAVPSFLLLAWFWPVFVLYGIVGPVPERVRARVLEEDEQRPLLREVGRRSPDDSAHDGDDEWEDVDDDDDDVDSEEEDEEEEEEYDHTAYRQLGGWSYAWWEVTRHSATV